MDIISVMRDPKYKNWISSAILVLIGLAFIEIHVLTQVYFHIWLFPVVMFLVYHYFNVWKLKPRILYGLLVIFLVYIIGNGIYAHTIYNAKPYWVKVPVSDDEAYFVRLTPFSGGKIYHYEVYINGTHNDSITLRIYKYDGSIKLFSMYSAEPTFRNNKTFYTINVSADKLEEGIYYFNYSFMNRADDKNIRYAALPGPINMDESSFYLFLCQSMAFSFSLLAVIYSMLMVAIHYTREGGRNAAEVGEE